MARSAKHSFGSGSWSSGKMELIGLTSCSPAGTAFSKSPLPIPNLAKDLKFGGYRLSCGKGNNDTIIQVNRVITEDEFQVWVHSIFIKFHNLHHVVTTKNCVPPCNLQGNIPKQVNLRCGLQYSCSYITSSEKNKSFIIALLFISDV